MIQDLAPVSAGAQHPVWFNDRLVPFDEATVHVITHALNYGTAVFEGIRVYDTVNGVSIFRMHEHLERLMASAQKFGIETPYSYDDIAAACVDTVAASGESHGYIRPQLQFGLSKPGLGNTDVVEFSVFFWPMGRYRKSDTLNVVLSEIERASPKAGDIEAKVTGYYTNSHFNLQYARRNGADDAIMLDINGNVAEAGSSNVFLVKDGILITPQTGYILKGITRSTIIELARQELNLELQERVVVPDELSVADEIFLTGTAAEINSVANYDGRVVGRGNVGPVSQRVKQVFSQVTRGELPDYMCWHTIV
ncbi:MAG: branched-chain amino acid transaminase [Woeseia sp.]